MAVDKPAIVKSADRVLDLLELLADGGRCLSHAQIAAALDIPKGSLTPLLRNLSARGYVATADGRSYRLGASLGRLAQDALSVRDLPRRVEPFLASLTREVGESSVFYQRKGDVVETMAAALGPQRLMAHMRVGDRAPLYATSGGKVMLAHLPESVIDAYLQRTELTPATPSTVARFEVLREMLERIRQTKIGYSLEEWTPGIVGIGTALLSGAGEPIGAVSVAMPTVRFSPEMRERVEAALLACVATIGDSLRR